jgi:23S rRNA (uracil1939-C5)-methyltransferase
VRVDSLAPGGDAVGRQQGGAHEGRATFVALAAPGERVQARLVREKARVAWAELVAVTEPSPARVAPPCPYFGVCGGCQWQHVTLDAQRSAKRAITERAVGIPVDLRAPVAVGTPYRDRARVAVGRRGEVGFRARHEHAIVDIERCLLLGAEAAQALVAIRSVAPAWGPGAEIELQAGNDGVHVAIRPGARGGAAPGTERPPDAAAALAAWRSAGVVGVRIDAGGERADRFGGTGGRANHISAAGTADVDVSEPGGAPLRIPAGGFAQVGRAANAALVDAVNAAIGSDPGKVLELYAGSGNFTRHLVARAAAVLASDADRAAVARGRRNAPGAAWATHPPAPRDVDAETVVADPPRAGLEGENLSAALAARRRLVYVSCDPQTLGRDAARLAREGFVLRDALAFDLMAHTFHVEVVATFDRVSRSG